MMQPVTPLAAQDLALCLKTIRDFDGNPQRRMVNMGSSGKNPGAAAA